MGAHKRIANLYRGCVKINFLDADDADDADFSWLLYPIGYNLSASSADEELNGGIFDTAPFPQIINDGEYFNLFAATIHLNEWIKKRFSMSDSE